MNKSVLNKQKIFVKKMVHVAQSYHLLKYGQRVPYKPTFIMARVAHNGRYYYSRRHVPNMITLYECNIGKNLPQKSCTHPLAARSWLELTLQLFEHVAFGSKHVYYTVAANMLKIGVIRVCFKLLGKIPGFIEWLERSQIKLQIIIENCNKCKNYCWIF